MANVHFSVAPSSRLQTPAGQPFTAVIVNYVGHADRAWEQFQPGKFDAALIEADFRLARRAGANVIRTFVDDPLQGEFPKGDWTKLDALVRAAEQAGVYLLLALADYNLSYVQTLAAHAGLIAARYAGRAVIMAYDLKNEPRFNDLLFLHYPAPLPLLTTPWIAPGLPTRSKAEAVAWARGEGKVPGWFDDAQAERYAAARAALDGCQRAISDFAAARGFNASAAEFVRSPEAAPWQSFLGALNDTLAAWLAPQLAAIRTADRGRPITVAYSDPLLAALPANAALDLIATNRYPRDNSARQLEFQLAVAGGLCAAFPDKPVLLTELGFATYEMDAGRASAAESAGWLRALELGLAGIGKWMLWDLPPGPNPVERSFGLFDATGAPKPAAYALAAVADIARIARGPLGRAALASAPGGEITYTFAADGARAAGGIAAAGDDVLRWEGSGWGQVTGCVARPGEIVVQAVAPGQITLDLGRLIGLSAAPAVTLTSGGAPVGFTTMGTALRFAAAPGAPIVCQAALVAVDARIVIVWPHGGAPVAEARLANLTAYLTFGDTRMSVPCDFARPVVLWRALNNEPAVPVAAGVRRLAEADGRQVPAWDFNDVDVSAARDPKNKIYFTLQVEGLPYRSNVWVHGSDARTFMPQQVQPAGHVVGTLGNPPTELDARIQILWPHGNAPVAEARLANLTADLFQHGTLVRVSPQTAASEMNPPPTLATWQPSVWLVRAVDNGVGQRVARGVMRRERPASGPVSLAPARWDFNDVDISATREAQHKLHFWVEVPGIRTYSNFWTHGADARTYLPNPETPLGDCRA